MEIAKKIELTASEIKGLETLPNDKKTIIQAMIDKKVLSGLKEDGVSFVFEVIKVTEINSGLTKLDNKDLTALAFSVYDLINENFKNLTHLELKTACKNGVIGNYGQWFGMCLKTFNEWIKAYLNAEVRKQAIKDWNLAVEKSQFSDKPIVNLDLFNKESCLRAFENYKNTGNMPMAAFAYYDTINDLIGVDYNGKKSLITDKAARKHLVSISEEEYQKMALNSKKRAEINGNFGAGETIMDALLTDVRALKSFERITKFNFLKYYFDYLIKNNIQLDFTEERF